MSFWGSDFCSVFFNRIGMGSVLSTLLVGLMACAGATAASTVQYVYEGEPFECFFPGCSLEGERLGGSLTLDLDKLPTGTLANSELSLSVVEVNSALLLFEARYSLTSAVSSFTETFPYTSPTLWEPAGFVVSAEGDIGRLISNGVCCENYLELTFDGNSDVISWQGNDYVGGPDITISSVSGDSVSFNGISAHPVDGLGSLLVRTTRHRCRYRFRWFFIRHC